MKGTAEKIREESHESSARVLPRDYLAGVAYQQRQVSGRLWLELKGGPIPA